MANSMKKLQEPLFALPFDTIIHGKYLIGRVLGLGGFGITYQGQNLDNGSFVAIKEYYPNGMVSRTPGAMNVEVITNYTMFQKWKEQFLQEARIIHHCRSKHILSIFSLFEENGTAYYVMEFLEGRDLMQYVGTKGGRIPWSELKYIVFQIMEALECVHREGIIHRDISPDNIYLCSDNTAKLIDFGTARSVVENKSMSIILKKGYAPPEQYMSKGVQGVWTDVYALGASIYRSLTGRIPQEALERVHGNQLLPINEFVSDVPAYVVDAINKAMNLDEKKRFQNISLFREALMEPKKKWIDGRVFSKKSFVDCISEYIYLWSKINPMLTGVSGIYVGQEFHLDEDIIFGRNPSRCNIVYPKESIGISEIHCQICMNVNGFRTIIDCDSSYGTFLNGVRLYPGRPAVLQSGSKIQLGNREIFVFSL